MKKLLGTVGIVILFSFLSLAAEADLEYVEGILDLTTVYYPQSVILSDTVPEDIFSSKPTYNGEPLYGTIQLAEDQYPVVVDTTETTATCYVKLKPQGILEKIPMIEAAGQYVASLSFVVSTDRSYRLLAVWSYRYPRTLITVRDCYLRGSIELHGASYEIVLIDEDTDGYYNDLQQITLLIDIDQSGELLTTLDSHERYTASDPFNVSGITYEISHVSNDGANVQIKRSDKDVPPKPPLETGVPAPVFRAMTDEQASISLEALRGKVVLLDFWASWCDPCIDELPTMVELAGSYDHDELAVVGINLDRDRSAFDTAKEQFNLSYPQIFDKEESISSLYRVSSIPMTYLIDQHGVILAKGLRGSKLRHAVQMAIK